MAETLYNMNYTVYNTVVYREHVWSCLNDFEIYTDFLLARETWESKKWCYL